jgi:hypothetical protein
VSGAGAGCCARVAAERGVEREQSIDEHRASTTTRRFVQCWKSPGCDPASLRACEPARMWFFRPRPQRVDPGPQCPAGEPPPTTAAQAGPSLHRCTTAPLQPPALLETLRGAFDAASPCSQCLHVCRGRATQHQLPENPPSPYGPLAAATRPQSSSVEHERDQPDQDPEPSLLHYPPTHPSLC